MIQTNTTSDNTNFFQVFGKEVVISKARYGNIWTLNTNNESISMTGFWDEIPLIYYRLLSQKVP
jgi:hypothetical protein